MRVADRTAGGTARLTADKQEDQAAGAQRCRPGMVAYSLGSGIVSLVAGAAASLIVTGTARVAVWCGVSAAVSVSTGLWYERGLMAGICRYLSRLARPPS